MDDELAETRSALAGGARPTAGSRPSADPSGGGFAPGEILVGRYRVVALLGTGGMGEVYRADDLRLGQPVALKFLTRELDGDPRAIERLNAEVRNARQVSHPHVCRVHDVDSVGGRHFLTMEYVDGEDLAALVRRIGRLPQDKAIEIARQVCAGLQAAHDRGVVHRDLKPANVMIDGHGRARITDFGLAVVGSGVAGEVAGTPAYMAPEQFAGEPATARTDLYALGLLLFEVCTGKRPFEGRSFADWRQAHTSTPPDPPSQRTRDIDPALERVILKCLEKEPARRPVSAAQVALALPGGDPLAAALAAGETPSPEMVAASPLRAVMSPSRAIGGVAAAMTLLLVLAYGVRFSALGKVPFELPAEALADRAARVITASFEPMAAPAKPRDREWGFVEELDYVGWEQDPLPTPRRWGRLAAGQPGYYVFWYRQAPMKLTPARGDGALSLQEPALSIEGEAAVRLDLRGRLIELLRVAPGRIPSPAGAEDSERLAETWTRLFDAAGLDHKAFRAVAAEWRPPMAADRQWAWSGTFADHADLPLRVEAAAYHDQVVWFRLIAPWESPPGATSGALEATQAAAGMTLMGLIGSVLLGSAWLARNNLRAGRGDRRGARRLAAATAAITATMALASSDFPLDLGGVFLGAMQASQQALLWAGATWLLYLAVEPSIRRSRPELLVSWSRAVAGELRDPLLGRDLLIGSLAGLSMAGAISLAGGLKEWTQYPGNPNHYLRTEALDSAPDAVAVVLQNLLTGLVWTLVVVAFVALVRRKINHPFIAPVALWALFCGLQVAVYARSWPIVLATLLIEAISLAVLFRRGMLASVASRFVYWTALTMPLTDDLQAPYLPITWVAIAPIAALVLWGAWIAVGTRPVGALDD